MGPKVVGLIARGAKKLAAAAAAAAVADAMAAQLVTPFSSTNQTK